jgi:class 3 adenylate cyclase
VQTCASCGRDNPEGSAFCNACGAALAPQAPAGELRKTVTVLFCDLVGSTALGEGLDPETVRTVLARWFEQAQAALERHGGTVEKYVGDAVMAVFGVPRVHEDDALRAVRAASELLGALARLNEELEHGLGARLAVRVGVNTGEVVAGAGQTFATGDAVNVAARLEQAAEPGEILLGELTYRLVRDAVRAEPVGRLVLKGKADAVPAFRLLELLPDVPAFTRRLDAPFVGRERELALLEEAFVRARGERSCELVTVVGAPGIGKSRLVRELVSTVRAEARVVVGRSLPYGAGATYRALAEIVEQVAGVDVRAGLADLLAGADDEALVTARVAAAVGAAQDGGPPEETQWAVRRLFEELARERPLLVVLDDVHWADPVFLDLLEYVAGFARDAPLLLVCGARPELLERRPRWPGAVVRLDSLSEPEAEALVERLLSGAPLEPDLRGRILAAAEGNPLFVEQMLAMAAETGNRDVHVPPTIQALLAERIDRLDYEERAAVECAAVEGRFFHRGAVAALVPEPVRPRVAPHLLALVRKDLVRPDRSSFPGDDGFRFAHMLVRDAAYESVPKRRRAELHERYARWLDAQPGERDELVGYHLEQAVAYREQLGVVDEHARALAEEAGQRLARAGLRANDRADAAAARDLLGRASRLVAADDPLRARVLPELALALAAGGAIEEGDALLVEAERLAASANAGLRARVLLARTAWSFYAGRDLDPDRLGADATALLGELEGSGDDLGLACAYHALAAAEGRRLQLAREEASLLSALEHARRAGVRRITADILHDLLSSPTYGTTPIPEAVARVERIRELAADEPLVEMRALRHLGRLRAKLGQFEEARVLIRRGSARLAELGFEAEAAGSLWVAADIELDAGEPEAAELLLRDAYDLIRRRGAPDMRISYGLVKTLIAQGRFEEAERLVEAATPRPEDVVAWSLLRARVLASRGELDEAEVVAREAIDVFDRSDRLDIRGDARVHLAEILRLASRPADAASALREALELYERRENVVGSKRARALLDQLEVPA